MEISSRLSQIIPLLRREAQKYAMPSVSQVALLQPDRPFRVLISCLLSLRTKDDVTFPASERLFARAPTLAALEKMDPKEIEKIIFPVGFYKTKAKRIPETICLALCVLMLLLTAGAQVIAPGTESSANQTVAEAKDSVEVPEKKEEVKTLIETEEPAETKAAVTA